jgi:hypothetical protein
MKHWTKLLAALLLSTGTAAALATQDRAGGDTEGQQQTARTPNGELADQMANAIKQAGFSALQGIVSDKVKSASKTESQPLVSGMFAMLKDSAAAAIAHADDSDRKPADSSKPDQQRAEAALKIAPADVEKVAQDCAANPLGVACAEGQKRIEAMTMGYLRLAEEAAKPDQAVKKPGTGAAGRAKPVAKE